MVGTRLHPAWLALILLGATAGTAARAGLEAAFAPGAGQWPWVTFWINVLGSFALGGLLEGLSGAGPDVGVRRWLRLGLGTGLLGGFTTYSTFAVETVLLLRSGNWVAGVTYASASVLAGLAAALLGVRLVRGAKRGRGASAAGSRR